MLKVSPREGTPSWFLNWGLLSFGTHPQLGNWRGGFSRRVFSKPGFDSRYVQDRSPKFGNCTRGPAWWSANLGNDGPLFGNWY